MNEVEYDFEELGLIVEGGFDVGLISGTATIKYQPDGEWSVREIELDGYRRRSQEARAEIAASQGKPVYVIGMFDNKKIPLCRDSNPWLYDTIVDRLENDPWRSHIADAIALARMDARDEYRAQLGKDRAHGLEA
jgi:hypothetical protein